MSDNEQQSLDPFEGMGERAKDEADKEIDKQKEKLDEQKEGD